MRQSLLLSTALCLSLCACSSVERGKTPSATAAPYIRIANADSNVVELQIAVRKFVPQRGAGPAVWLAGVSHIGESNYFAAMQRQLDRQSLVLFEGINNRSASKRVKTGLEPTEREAAGSSHGEEQTPPPPPRNISSLQTSMAAALGLVFQLDAIDYRRSSFRNSDLSVAQLRELLAQQPPAQDGSPGASQGFEALLQAMQGSSLFDALLHLGMRFLGASPKLQALGKLALIDVIGEIKGDPAQLRGVGPSMQQLFEVLVQKRNEKVIGDLRNALKTFGPADSVAIFYGTGHMPDMELRLRKELHYRPAEQVWLSAISVDLRLAGVSPTEQKFIYDFVHREFGPGS